MATPLDWRKLNPPPNAIFSELLSLNDNEFIVVPQRPDLQNQTYKDCNGIHKYNAINNKWTKIFDYPQDFESLAHKAAIDIKNNIIYICNEEKLFEINLITKNVKMIKNEMNLNLDFFCK